MAYKPKAAKSPDDLTERRKELIFLDGYDVTDGVTVFTASPNTEDVNLPVFGQDENITGTSVTSAGVNISALEPNESIPQLVRLLHNQRPSKDPLANPTQYRTKDIDPVNVLVMRKNNSDEKIINSKFFAGVTFAPAYPEGAPNDKSVRAYTGTGGPAREFDSIITADLVQSGEALRSAPYEVPREVSGTYAAYIEMIEVPSGGTIGSAGLVREPIRTPTPDMVDSDGNITWSELTGSVSLSNPTYAHVYYMLSGVTGIPDTTSTINPEGMRGDIT